MGAPSVVCPAASTIGPPALGPSVLCGVIANANRGAEIDGFVARGQVSPVISDRDTIATACAGCGIPGSSGPTYTGCVVWQAEKDRIAAARAADANGLIDPLADVQARDRDGLAGVAEKIDRQLAGA